MRKLIGTFFVLFAAFFAYEFAVLGTVLAERTPGPSIHCAPFQTLGQQYPIDAGLLTVTVWSLGAGLYFLISSKAPAPVPAFLPLIGGAPPKAPSSPMAVLFLLNALLLITVLFLAFLGVRAQTGETRLVAVLSLAAGLQVALGLILLILALFEKPKGPASLLLGFALYVAGAAAAVLVFLWGRLPVIPS